MQITIKPGTATAQEWQRPLSVVPPWEREQVHPPPPCNTQNCKKLDQQLNSQCSAPKDIPYAETYFQRKGLKTSLSTQQRRLIALVYMAGSTTFAQENLAEALASTTEPEFRYIAGLALANVSLKSGESPLSEAFVTGLEAMRSSNPLGSDFLYLESLHLRATGRDSRAQLRLMEALREDPRHFSALITSIKWAFSKVSYEQVRSISTCQAAYKEMFGNLATLMDLEPCRFMAAHVSVLLQREYADPDRTAALQAALVYTSILAGRTEAALVARERFGTIVGVRCTSDVLSLLDDFLSLAKIEQ